MNIGKDNIYIAYTIRLLLDNTDNRLTVLVNCRNIFTDHLKQMKYELLVLNYQYDT